MTQCFGQKVHVCQNVKAGVSVKMYRKTDILFLFSENKDNQAIILQKQK